MNVARRAPAVGRTRVMGYPTYLAWEGGCSIVLGIALAIPALAVLAADGEAWWPALLFVPAVLAALALWARLRRGTPLTAAGRWLTERPLARAAAGAGALDASRLRRRLVAETALWIVLVDAWVIATGSSALLVLGTGLASVAFGLVQAVAARRHVARSERRDGRRYLVAARPGLGSPSLSWAA